MLSGTVAEKMKLAIVIDAFNDIYIYIYIYTCIHTFLHRFTYIYIYIICICICVCMYVCMYVCMHVCMYVYVCVCISVIYICIVSTIPTANLTLMMLLGLRVGEGQVLESLLTNKRRQALEPQKPLNPKPET